MNKYIIETAFNGICFLTNGTETGIRGAHLDYLFDIGVSIYMTDIDWPRLQTE
jgi:hypothetical protein